MPPSNSVDDEQAALKAEIRRLTARIGRLQDEKAAHEAELAALRAERFVFAQSIGRSEGRREELQVENARLLATIRHLESQLRAVQAEQAPPQPEQEEVADPEKGSHMQFYLDHPVQGSVFSLARPIPISGWAFSEAGPTIRFEVWIADERVGTLSHGDARPDVAAAFQGKAHTAESGYSGRITPPPVQPGPHELIVRARDEAGNVQSVRRTIVLAASPVGVLPEPLFRQKERPAPDERGQATLTVERAVWRDGQVELEGWVLWPDSLPPRLAHIWRGEHLLGKTRCELARPDISVRCIDALKPACRGFHFFGPLTLDPQDAQPDSRRLSVEVVDKKGEALREEITLDVAPDALSGTVEGVPALRAFLLDFQARRGRAPNVLDWNTGLLEPRHFPEIAVFSPPVSHDRPILPYLDKSIEVVLCPSSDEAFVAEAKRVAAEAVLVFDHTHLQVAWQSQTDEASPGASLIIPVFNQADYTENCLAQLKSTLPDAFGGEIIVVDDASDDETAGRLAAIAEAWPAVRVLRNTRNLGFIHSCNRGAEAATQEFLVFLNNDTLPQPGWFSSLLETFTQYPDAGAVGGKLIYPEGTLQEAGGIIFSNGAAANFGNSDPLIDHPLYNHLREVDYCSGALLATRRALFEAIGGFDTRYQPAYYEDVDYCFEVRRKGFKVYYQPESVVIHFEGVSSGADVKSGVKRYQVLNQDRFFDKWRPVLDRQPLPVQEVSPAILHRLVARETVENGEHDGD